MERTPETKMLETALLDDPLTLRRFTREEYERLCETGFFREGERIELVDGRILNVPPQTPEHSGGTNIVVAALRVAFGNGFDFRVQQPLVLDPDSEPEPDVAVVPGSGRDYVKAHPTSALLVVEIARTSVRLDRLKGKVYARAGIADYWIVNLVDHQVEVHRDPQGDAYRTVTTHASGEIKPIAAAHALKVADLLP